MAGGIMKFVATVEGRIIKDGKFFIQIDSTGIKRHFLPKSTEQMDFFVGKIGLKLWFKAVDHSEEGRIMVKSTLPYNSMHQEMKRYSSTKRLKVESEFKRTALEGEASRMKCDSLHKNYTKGNSRLTIRKGEK